MSRTFLPDGLAIEALKPHDAGRIADHFARLSPDDRALRFNSALVDDAQIARYVRQMRFGEDVVLGLVDPIGRIVGVAHGCVFDVAGERRVEAAFSVEAAHRGRGYGHALMRSLQAAAAEGGAGVIVGVCSARNRPMRRVFERAGMDLEREEDELQGRLAIVPHAASGGEVRSGRSGKAPSR